MDWLNEAALRLREWLMQQVWLDGWQSSIARTPDWALLAAGPGLALLLALLLWAQAPLGRRAAERREPNTSPSMPQAKTREKSCTPAAATANTTQVAPGLRTATTPVARAEQTARAAQEEAQANTPVRRASGVPDPNEQVRKARVFLSSTFRDMRAERDVLATETFPLLKRRFRARGVELQEVDLRWGVNEGDATLDVCLQAVRRSNWFVGLIGQRYGTTLDDEATVEQLGPEYPAVANGLGRSLTEIEILEGVLLSAKSDKKTLFFERDQKWLDRLSPSERVKYEDQEPDPRARLTDLKTRVRERVGVMHAYPSPEEIGGVFKATMTEALEKAFPPLEGVDDPFMQEHRLHAAYARERLGLYIGGDDYVGTLNEGAEGDGAPQLVVGESGGGKSALVANWVQKWHAANARDIIFAHYLGASPESAAPAALVRRLWRHLNAVTGEEAVPPNVDATLDELRDAMLDRLGQANAFAVRENCRIVIALDGLDKLADEHLDLRWWPRALPPRVKLVVSSLAGKAREAGRERGWSERPVKPFDAARRDLFIAETLKSWNKSDFPEERKQRVLAHAMAGLPLFLKTILEELRVSAVNDVLDVRLDDYLKAAKMPDLYARILAQIEDECGKDFVSQALSLIWASRAGLEEDEIIAIISQTQRMALGPAGLAWERLRNRLADNLRDSQGRVAFSHDYLRQAVEAVYLKSEDAKRRAHLTIADRFAAREADSRQAEEVPFQLREANAWEALEAFLVNPLSLPYLIKDFDVLFGYWRPLIHRGVSAEEAICNAFAAMGEVQNWSESTLNLGEIVSEYLQATTAAGGHLVALWEKCICGSERIRGALARKTLQTRMMHATTVLFTGDRDRAVGLLRGLVQEMEKALGPEDDVTCEALIEMSRALLATSRPAEAAAILERILAIDEARYGRHHEITLQAKHNLAAALDDPTRRIQLLREVYRARLAGANEADPGVLATLDALAVAFADAGNLTKALKYSERAFRLHVHHFGIEHQFSLFLGSNLGALQMRAELFDRARETITTCIEGARDPEGTRGDVRVAWANWSLLERARGDYSAAIALISKVAAAARRSHGPGGREELDALAMLALTQAESGDFAGAHESATTALEGRTRLLGADHPLTKQTQLLRERLSRQVSGLEDPGGSRG